jgi:predicted O-linked N-acetylglucosamine transferase (SPINDLY family)
VTASKTARKKADASAARDTAVAALTAAAKAHEQGDLVAAERGYREALAAAPDLPDALQLLGVARHQQGASLEAMDLLGRAKALAPRSPAVRTNLGSVLNAVGRHAEAVEEFRAALALEPRDAEVWCNLGVALRAAGRMTEAAEAFERAIGFASTAPKPHLELANLYLALRDFPRCEAAYRAYTALVSDDPAALSNLAYAIQCQGRLDEAEELFGRAIDLASDAPELRHNLRTLLREQGRADEARAALHTLLEKNPELWKAELGVAVGLLARGATAEAMRTIQDILDAFPDDAVIWNDIGLVLLSLEKVAEGAEILKKATEIDPEMALAHNNYGAALNYMHLSQLAIPPLREALRLQPNLVDPHINLVRAYSQVGDLDHASMFARAALELPDFRPANFINLAQCFRKTCDFESDDRLGDVWENCGQVPLKALPGVFLDLLVYARSHEEVLAFVALVRRWAELIEAQAATTPLPAPVKRRRASDERLRIGFLSADLRMHSVTRFLLPLMKHYDRERFAVHCYTPVRVLGDPIQVLLQETVDKFTFVENRSNYEFAKIIRDDEIDILFELNGFTEASRLDVLAWRPAPVQISWLGYPFTCGLKAIDHVVLDRFVKPEDPAFLVEEPILMPEAWVCFGKFPDVPIAPTLPLDRNGVVTFGTLNNPYKYTREMIALWARVMNAVPGSRFLVVRPEASSLTLVRNIAREFEKNGVSPDRLFFFDNRREHKNHLSYYNDVDISLDTFPLTGGTTTCEATWMGVPVVSLVGESFHQRISYSVLMQCGLDELCAFTPEDFVAKAVALASDVPRVRAMRHGLRDVLRASPLCDEPRFLHQFQEMLEQVAVHHGIR